jgi:hypothetical protein
MHGRGELAIAAMVVRRIEQLQEQQWRQLLVLDRFCQPTTPAPR